MDTRQTIIDLLRNTGRKGIENVIELLENSNFFSIGCHSHHKYEGGLADHALETLSIARRRCRNVSDESIVIASLLHDLCDINRYRKIKGHGWRSAELLTKICHLEMSTDEYNAIRYHMKDKYERPVRTSLELGVYTADKRSAFKHSAHSLDE